MRTIGAILAVLSFLLLGGCGGSSDAGSSSGQSSASATRSSEAASGGSDGSSVVTIATGNEEVEVRVEVADDAAEQQRGLMGRTDLGEDRGMLFVFDGEQELSFWMRGTLIPLSIAYMDSEGRIVDIQNMKALDDEEPHYVSAEPSQYALEVNRGFFDEQGVEVGDRAELPN